MSMHNGWYPRLRSILAALEKGEVSLLDVAVHDFLALTSDFTTAVSWSSAQKIYALAGVDVSVRMVQRSLARLEAVGWVKRFRIDGKHGNYPIVVGHRPVKILQLSGTSCHRSDTETSPSWYVANLVATTDYKHVQFARVTEASLLADAAVTREGTERASEVSPVLEVRRENFRRESKPRLRREITGAIHGPAGKYAGRG